MLLLALTGCLCLHGVILWLRIKELTGQLRDQERSRRVATRTEKDNAAFPHPDEVKGYWDYHDSSARQ